MVADRRYGWRESGVVLVGLMIATGGVAVRMIRVVFLVGRRILVTVAAKVKMRSRRVILRLCDVGSVMRVRKAQALDGQHQKNEQ